MPTITKRTPNVFGGYTYYFDDEAELVCNGEGRVGRSIAMKLPLEDYRLAIEAYVEELRNA